MLFATLLGAAAIVGAQANGDRKGYKNHKAGYPARGEKSPARDEYHETNPGCPDDVLVKLRWHGAADLDLFVEGPGMCKISTDNPVSKWGGVLVEDVIPGYCEPHPYEEVIKFSSGVANGGIYKIDAFYFDDGGCHTGHVDYHVTVHMGGHEIETFSGTLNKGEHTEPYYVLGYRSGYGCDKRPEKPYLEPKHPRRKDDKKDRRRPDDKGRRPDDKGSRPDDKNRRRPDDKGRRPDDKDRKGGRRHLLNGDGKEEYPRKDDYGDDYDYGYDKCPCFKGKVVHERGTCEMHDEDYDDGSGRFVYTDEDTTETPAAAPEEQPDVVVPEVPQE